MADPAAHQVTTLLDAASRGDTMATEELLPLVYEQLRVLAASQMAKEPPGQTLQATALVHEAYLRLVGSHPVDWNGRGHFYAAAARSMRQILVNRAQCRRTLKRGGGRLRLDMDQIDSVAREPPWADMLSLHEALERFEHFAPRQAKVVLLRYFAGLSVDETAKALGMSPRTVDRDWRFAKAWLYEAMRSGDQRRE